MILHKLIIYFSRKVIPLVIMLFFYSCTSTKLPICSKLSKSNPSAIGGISQTLFTICEQRNIQITVLSCTIAEFKGSKKQINWLNNNYFITFCDFAQSTTINDEAIYGACMKNSKKWIKIVQGKNPETLMLDGIYCSVCCE